MLRSFGGGALRLCEWVDACMQEALAASCSRNTKDTQGLWAWRPNTRHAGRKGKDRHAAPGPACFAGARDLRMCSFLPPEARGDLFLISLGPEAGLAHKNNRG